MKTARKCSITPRQRMAFADDQLTGRERMEVESHLRLCEECRQEVRLERSLRARVEKSRRIPEAEKRDIASAVMAQIRREPVPKPAWRPLAGLWGQFTPLRVAGWAGLATAVILITVYLGGFPGGVPSDVPSDVPQASGPRSIDPVPMEETVVLRAPLDIEIDTDLDANVSFFATREATVVWIEERTSVI